MAKQVWSELSETERLNRLAKVLTRAGADSAFREACLNPETGQATIEEEAEVTFDGDIKVRCFTNQEAAEKEIVLVLPETPAPDGTQHRAEDGRWICTAPTGRARPES
jgi:hypothetical protein